MVVKWLKYILLTLIIIAFTVYQSMLHVMRMQWDSLVLVILLSLIALTVFWVSLKTKSSQSSSLIHYVSALIPLYFIISWGQRFVTNLSNTSVQLMVAYAVLGFLFMGAWFYVWLGPIFDVLRARIGSFLAALVVFVFQSGVWLPHTTMGGAWQVAFPNPWIILMMLGGVLVIRIRTKRTGYAYASWMFMMVTLGVLVPQGFANIVSPQPYYQYMVYQNWLFGFGYFSLLLGILSIVWTPRPLKTIRQLRHVPIAHRGFYNEHAPENTLPAYELAMERNFAIECDVRLTKDGQLVMFHDDTLLRQFGDSRKISDCTWEELHTLQFPGTRIGIPTFLQFLHRVNGRVLIVLELKPMGSQRHRLAQLVIDQLRDYEGEIVVQSFDPLTMFYFAEYAPHYGRGQLYFSYDKSGLSKPMNWLLGHLFFNIVVWPDFLNGYKDYRLSLVQFYRLFIPVIGFTVTSEEEFQKALTHYDNLIFEHFVPARFIDGVLGANELS
jgi:glycerophosphoryl diester phosphodiesterase